MDSSRKRLKIEQEPDHERKLQDNLLDELVRRGGHFHKCLKIVSGDTGLGIIADDQVVTGSVLARCPVDYAITSASSKIALTDLAVQCADLEATVLSVLYLGLCRRLLIQDTASMPKHRAYVTLLPAPERLTTPVWWSEKHLELLTGTNLYHAVLQRRALWKEEWQICLSALENSQICHADYSLQDHLWARTMFSSRSFPPSLAGLDEEAGPVLFPVIDLFDHKRGQPVEWALSDDKEHKRSFALVARSSIASGSSVYNNYGAKSNEELLLGYGFVLEDNPEDVVTLKVDPQRLVLKNDEGRFHLPRKLRPDSPALLALLGELLCIQPEVDMKAFLSLYNADATLAVKTPPLIESDGRGDASLQASLQCRIRLLLQDMLGERLDKIPETDWEASALRRLSRTTRDMARSYVTMQANILSDAIEVLQNQCLELHSLLPEEARCQCSQVSLS